MNQPEGRGGGVSGRAAGLVSSWSRGQGKGAGASTTRLGEGSDSRGGSGRVEDRVGAWGLTPPVGGSLWVG